jgi:hypothetical protein
MSFESPDSLQISTRLGKPSAEQVPEIIPTPETPPAPAAALPAQDDFKISTRLQPDAHRELPVELAEATSVKKPENPAKPGVLDALAKVLATTPEGLFARSTHTQGNEAAKDQPKSFTLNIKFGDEVRVFNAEGQIEKGWTYAGKGENGTVRLVHGRNNGEHRDVTITELQAWYKQSLKKTVESNSAIELPTSPANTAPEQTTNAENSQISPEIIARAKEIIAKLDIPGNMPAQLTKSTEEILRAYGFSQDDINSRTPQDLLEELRERVKRSPNQAETTTESEWQTIDGDTVKADTRLERNGMHVGDYLKLSNARQGLFGPIIESATTLQIVGFTDEASDDRVIVQIDHDRVRLIYGWDINKYFELTKTTATVPPPQKSNSQTLSTPQIKTTPLQP